MNNANKAIQDVDKIITELHVAGGYSDNPFSDLGGGMFGVQRLETEHSAGADRGLLSGS